MKLEIDIPYYVFEQIKRENTIKNVLNRIDFAIRNGEERPHGEWIEILPFSTGKCSLCGNVANITNFCPNCGARMKRSE